MANEEPDVRITRARFNEQAERHKDMAAAMKEYIEGGGKMEDDTRNLLSVAYKNVVGALRSSLRIVASNCERKDQHHNFKDYQTVLESELKTCCDEILKLIDDHLLPSVKNSTESEDEAVVFYSKMKGDYYRYLAEAFRTDETKKNSEDAYKEAQEAAEKLANTHPIKLGLALNFSVFYYEIKNEKQKACELAKMAFDDAISEMDTQKEEHYKDSALIMQLLRDNLTLWTSEDQDNDDEEGR